ncbi:MAG: roadblock/LC7 domain-containing protein [Desulfuromonadales bacterium]|jgi:predicted regulator of Ras-like GTPase activity (Roadblock/LC7/MglB family)|uniref:roadblock/LC7 domain-containing protein n=1 Tax=Desulfuromonas sp. KJ2020 TaxID=2919173 RepID=UPI0020A734E6|nr:roadblock/LC7 domain-containing protein [Desulfuromonas sp. KJ2020]MCP3177425.1 roadblock/LC7 domain-containing protein [Desulfuromonas sp. KJ2020]
MFAEMLQGIVEKTPGGVGAVLMGYDGIAIDQYFLPIEDVDLQLVSVEYANILKEIRKTIEVLGTGAMEEVVIRTSQFYVILRSVGQDYFVALTVGSDGNFGKGRYLLMKETPRFLEALQ